MSEDNILGAGTPKKYKKLLSEIIVSWTFTSLKMKEIEFYLVNNIEIFSSIVMFVNLKGINHQKLQIILNRF